MRYHALACDYDGTIAHHGKVDAATLSALKNVRKSGRRLLLVTGRQLDSLAETFPELDVFDQIVAENGALLYTPATRDEKVLAEVPAAGFVQALKDRGVAPLSVGRAIVATWTPHEKTVLEVIRELGLELQVIFNKGAVMVLPPGINKATGLKAALAEMKLSPHNVVAVGDAENDHTFLALCECSVAVNNALPALKERADLVTHGDHGRGVSELIDMLLRDDLAGLGRRLSRHDILLGTDDAGNDVHLESHAGTTLVAGTSGGGKSTLTTGVLERVVGKGYQICIIDPEGDYEHFEHAVVLGTSDNSPTAGEALEVLDNPQRSVALNLLALRVDERPAFTAELLPQLMKLRSATGRPHWIVIDETHHLFPKDWSGADGMVPEELSRLILITVHPDHVSLSLLSMVDTIIALGANPDGTILDFCQGAGFQPPPALDRTLKAGEALLWHVNDPAPAWFKSAPPSRQLRRHLRKYAEGRLGEDRSFYFCGAERRLNLRAYNLASFIEIGKGLDDATWLHHLRQGDYSRWISTSIKDQELAEKVAAVEQQPQISAEESHQLISKEIEKRYTLPA
jgi:HAD superfamily hydrolase (TIGR01484 family)